MAQKGDTTTYNHGQSDGLVLKPLITCNLCTYCVPTCDGSSYMLNLNSVSVCCLGLADIYNLPCLLFIIFLFIIMIVLDNTYMYLYDKIILNPLHAECFICVS